MLDHNVFVYVWMVQLFKKLNSPLPSVIIVKLVTVFYSSCVVGRKIAYFVKFQPTEQGLSTRLPNQLFVRLLNDRDGKWIMWGYLLSVTKSVTGH